MTLNQATVALASRKVEAPKKQSNAPKAGVENAVLFAVISMLESISTATQSSMVRAKELEANGAAQQRIIDEMGNLKWEVEGQRFLLSTYYTKYHYSKTVRTFWGRKYHLSGTRIDKHHGRHTHYKPGRKVTVTLFGIKYHERTKSHKYYTWGPDDNKAAIAAAQAHNEQNSAIRDYLSDELAVSQQAARIQETNAGNQVNYSAQTTQEAGSLLQMLKQLTDKILQPRRNRR